MEHTTGMYLFFEELLVALLLLLAAEHTWVNIYV